MDIWEKLYNAAKDEYHPEQVSPFIDAHHVVCAIEAEDGQIFTGFCIEGASGVIALCAERLAGINMYMQSGQTVVKRMIAFRSEPPKENGGMPCGACREFFLQLADKNKDMEFFSAEWTNQVTLYPGNMAIIFPNDLHAGGYIAEKTETVKKLVFKLKI